MILRERLTLPRDLQPHILAQSIQDKSADRQHIYTHAYMGRLIMPLFQLLAREHVHRKGTETILRLLLLPSR